MSEYKGNDISYCQEGINIESLKANGTEFVIIRAGISESKDVTVDGHVKNCSKANMPYGFYWYACAETVEEAKREADACVKVCRAFNPELPIFYDVERKSQYNLPKQTLTDMFVTFCETVKKAGFIAGVYLNPSMWNLIDGSKLKSYEVWLADWRYIPPEKAPYISKTNATMWQWGTEQVAGKTVDADIGYKKYWNDKPVPEPTAPTLKKGDKVTVNKGAKFDNGVQPFNFVYNTVFDVNRISKNGEEACIGLDGVDTGWMYVKDLKKVTETEPKPTQPVQTLKVGDKVKVDLGATTYDNRGLASFVYVLKYDVMQIDGDRVVIGQNGQVTAAVRAKDLKKI